MIEGIKPRVVKVAIVNGVDRGLYKRDFEAKQMVIDLVNVSVADMWTSDMLQKLSGNALASLDANMQKQFIDIVAYVGQDRLLQMLSKTRERTLVESLVSFGVAEMGTPLLAKTAGM